MGTRDTNEVVLSDPAVSRLHLELRADDHGWRLRDLGSRNGTWIGDLRVQDVYLAPGTTLRVGDTEIRFEPLEEEVEVPLASDERYGQLVGRSPAMRGLFALLARVATTDATALIEGESGTGKEGVAHAIHAHGPRAEGPYVVFDCAAVSGSLLESELFGHERGAFTGASVARAGAVQEAEGGTLFLDEIGELPLELQPKLLRLLEQKEYRRVGSSKARRADVRVLAATHRDLAKMVNEGRFREDLFYRLAVIQVPVPPLRDRPDDVAPLVAHFVQAEAGADARRVLDGISRDAWRRLEKHPWPGNVRELRNVVQRMLVLGTPAAPQPGVAPSASAAESAPRSGPSGGGVEVDLSRPWMDQKRDLVGRLEARYLRGVLDAHAGNITHAAAFAGIERMYFKRLCKKHGVE